MRLSGGLCLQKKYNIQNEINKRVLSSKSFSTFESRMLHRVFIRLKPESLWYIRDYRLLIFVVVLVVC